MFEIVNVELDWKGLNLKARNRINGATSRWSSSSNSGGLPLFYAQSAASKNADPNIDFSPLSVHIILKKHMQLVKIPGGYFKREGRPSENEILDQG